MKLLCLLSVMISLSNTVSAQTKEDLYGTWYVTDVEFTRDLGLSESERTQFDEIMRAMDNARFELKNNQEINFEHSYRDLSIHNGYWIYNQSSRKLTITDWYNRSNVLLTIRVEEDGYNGLKLRLGNSPIIVSVEK